MDEILIAAIVETQKKKKKTTTGDGAFGQAGIRDSADPASHRPEKNNERTGSVSLTTATHGIHGSLGLRRRGLLKEHWLGAAGAWRRRLRPRRGAEAMFLACRPPPWGSGHRRRPTRFGGRAAADPAERERGLHASEVRRRSGEARPREDWKAIRVFKTPIYFQMSPWIATIHHDPIIYTLPQQFVCSSHNI